jgi:hypothetical protein
MPTVVVREDCNLVVACEFCHLTAGEAVAVLRHRLDKRQRTEACGGCALRMAREVTAQLKPGATS